MEKFGIILSVGKIDSFMIRRGRENLPEVCLWGHWSSYIVYYKKTTVMEIEFIRQREEERKRGEGVIGVQVLHS